MSTPNNLKYYRDDSIAVMVRQASAELNRNGPSIKETLRNLRQPIESTQARYPNMWSLLHLLLGNDGKSSSDVFDSLALVSVVEQLQKISNVRSISPLQLLICNRLESTGTNRDVMAFLGKLAMLPSVKTFRKYVVQDKFLSTAELPAPSGSSFQLIGIDTTYVGIAREGRAKTVTPIFVELKRFVNLSDTAQQLRVDAISAFNHALDIEGAREEMKWMFGQSSCFNSGFATTLLHLPEAAPVSYETNQPTDSRSEYSARVQITSYSGVDSKKAQDVRNWLERQKSTHSANQLLLIFCDHEILKILWQVKDPSVVALPGTWHAEYHYLSAIFDVWRDFLFEPLAKKLKVKKLTMSEGKGNSVRIRFRIVKKFIISLVRHALRYLRHQPDALRDFRAYMEQFRATKPRYYSFLFFLWSSGFPYVCLVRAIRSNDHATWRQALLNSLPHFITTGKKHYQQIVIRYEFLWTRATPEFRQVLQRCFAVPATSESKYFCGNDDAVEQVRFVMSDRPSQEYVSVPALLTNRFSVPHQ